MHIMEKKFTFDKNFWILTKTNNDEWCFKEEVSKLNKTIQIWV